MKPEDNDPNEAKIQSSMESMGAGLTEVILDAVVTTEGILKDIPIASTCIGFLNAARSFKDKMFEKKLRNFLEQLKDTTLEQRKSKVEKIESDDEYKIKVGENLLYIIDRSEDHEVASIIGELFAAYLSSKLTYSEFLQASSLVNSLALHGLKRFLSMPVAKELPLTPEAYRPRNRNEYTKIDSIGSLAFSGLYKIRNNASVNATLVVETSIAGKLREIIGTNTE